MVCQDVELKGDITISSGIAIEKLGRACIHGWYRTGTIVHPKATIFAIAGPIVIGANCIIEEAVIIVNRCGCMRMPM